MMNVFEPAPEPIAKRKPRTQVKGAVIKKVPVKKPAIKKTLTKVKQ